MTGKIFEVGTYSEIGFEISEDELSAAAAEFKPIETDLEHGPTKEVLGNQLGMLTRVWMIGTSLMGELWIPQWLSKLTKGKLSVSLAFNEAKKIVGIALTLSPRIPDAEVFEASFSAKPGEPSWLKRIFGRPSVAAGQILPPSVVAKNVDEKLLSDVVPGIGAAFAESAVSGTDRMRKLLSHSDLGKASMSLKEKR